MPPAPGFIVPYQPDTRDQGPGPRGAPLSPAAPRRTGHGVPRRGHVGPALRSQSTPRASPASHVPPCLRAPARGDRSRSAWQAATVGSMQELGEGGRADNHGGARCPRPGQSPPEMRSLSETNGTFDQAMQALINTRWTAGSRPHTRFPRRSAPEHCARRSPMLFPPCNSSRTRT